MYKKTVVIILIIFIAAIFAGCNIFGWLYPDEDISGDVEDLIAKGEAALRNGKPAEALKYYNEAIKKDSKSSEARWGYVKAYILTKNVDLILIASKLTAGEDPASIISGSAATLEEIMNVVVTYLDPIAHGQCDGVVPATDFGVNLNLMLAYMIRGFLKNGDSNNDGNYFSTTGPGGGDIFIFQNGELIYNSAVVDIEGLSQTLTSTFDEVLNSLSTEPPSELSRATVSNLLRVSHNLIEDLLLVYSVMGSSFDDFTGGMYALNNAVVGLATGDVVEELKKELENRYNEAKSYLDGAEIDACNLNDDHFRLVGTNVNGYPGSCPENWYANFTKSPWSPDHDNPPDTTYAPGKTNLYRRFLNKSGNYFTNGAPPSQISNELIFISDVTNTVSKIFRDVENSNLLKNLMGVQ